MVSDFGSEALEQSRTVIDGTGQSREKSKIILRAIPGTGGEQAVMAYLGLNPEKQRHR